MNTIEMRQRLEDLNNLLDGRTKLEPAQKKEHLQEAMQLADDLGLDRARTRFHQLLERIERAEK